LKKIKNDLSNLIEIEKKTMPKIHEEYKNGMKSILSWMEFIIDMQLIGHKEM
jgi:hypothetical protein